MQRVSKNALQVKRLTMITNQLLTLKKACGSTELKNVKCYNTFFVASSADGADFRLAANALRRLASLAIDDRCLSQPRPATCRDHDRSTRLGAGGSGIAGYLSDRNRVEWCQRSPGSPDNLRRRAVGHLRRIRLGEPTSIRTARSLCERLATIQNQLPPEVVPQLSPISSIMGQIMIVGIWSENQDTTPMELRTLADWVIRQRLRTIPGVSQVFVMGGDRKQFQVLVSPDQLLRYDVTLHEVETALAKSNENVTGGYLKQQGPYELLVRSLGRVTSVKQIEDIVVDHREDRPILLKQVARVIEGPEVKRGDARATVRTGENEWSGGPAVLLTINKQPGADTRQITEEVTQALKELKASLPSDVQISTELYQQRAFIDRAVTNVLEALRDGSILVVIILFVFLMNFRTTFITLTAIPLSLVITALVFKWTGMSINTMTLGGLAVAIGEIGRRRYRLMWKTSSAGFAKNQVLPNPRPKLRVVYEASCEVRNSIVFGTLIVVLVFLPVFALGGMEGRLFTPLGIAYIVSIVSSLLVSLTLTPVLSYLLLGTVTTKKHLQDGILLRGIKKIAAYCIRKSTQHATVVLLGTTAIVIAFGIALLQLESDFLPPFNEGTVQINVILKPGHLAGRFASCRARCRTTAKEG